ncbi:MAG: hypothetical protein KGJ89_05050 [Patescibacteria group bacterium]|nr:hypothetical protein [Patescibacteria group bacterium]MDE2227289.1 hypothetical protein [Patescibacteria group bacterium]
MALTNKRSIKLTASGIVTTAGKAGILLGYNLVGGTTASSATFTDGGAGGTELWKGTIKSQTSIGDADQSEHFTDGGVVFTTDIYCTLAGTGAYVYVHYSEIQV